MYSVNLATGFYETVSSDMGTTSKINAIGYNVVDDYMYGYSKELAKIVRIGDDYQISPLAVTGLPSTSFYVGDVAIDEEAYYFYKPGSQFGLYKTMLSSSHPDYLSVSQIIGGAELNIKIFDFAFHPGNGFIYAVDAYGELHKINPDNGASETIASLGVTGTFGASYFDDAGNLYFSRNQDGHIFRVATVTAPYTAEFFAFGPSSSNNDGARCALSSIVSDTATIDYGGAPESYGSNIDNNGARHDYELGMQLGNAWGGSDDGLAFITEIETDTTAILSADIKGSGTLNIWGDWNRDGEFSSNEHAIIDQSVSEGRNLIALSVPEGSSAGLTWVRARYSSQQGIGPNGGVSNGEVEDYQIEVMAQGTMKVSYPSTSGFSTIAFEDNWPALGDYDMNDVVIAMRTHIYYNSNLEAIRYDIEGKVQALGAGYHNGFGVVLDNIPSSQLNTETSVLYVNGFQVTRPLIEDNASSDDGVIIISTDMKNQITLDSNCLYYRTEPGCVDLESSDSLSFRAVVQLNSPVPQGTSPTGLLNPFIFATPGIYHGDSFATPPGRALEIHLKNRAVSVQFDPSFWGLEDDRSNGTNNTFVNDMQMPWAIEIPITWSHPKERVVITEAYPSFFNFVSTGGESNTLWYTPEFIQNTSLTISSGIEL